jgi:hypothetical protein
MATTDLRIAKLSQEAAEHFDRYREQARARSMADKKARTAKDRAKESLVAIVEELGEFVMGELPDGRVIQVIEQKRDVKAQKARTDTWQVLEEVPVG